MSQICYIQNFELVEVGLELNCANRLVSESFEHIESGYWKKYVGQTFHLCVSQNLNSNWGP